MFHSLVSTFSYVSVSMGLGVDMPPCKGGGQRTTFMNQSSVTPYVSQVFRLGSKCLCPLIHLTALIGFVYKRTLCFFVKTILKYLIYFDIIVNRVVLILFLHCVAILQKSNSFVYLPFPTHPFL